MIDEFGEHILKFKKYKIMSLNPKVKGIRIVENSVIVKLAEYIETDTLKVISVNSSLAVKEPSEVDVTDAKLLQTSRFIQVALDVRHEKDYSEYIWSLEDEELKPDGSNAFLLVSDAMWKTENEQLAGNHLMTAPEDEFIGTFTPLTNFINDTINCKILLKEIKGEFLPDKDITMFLSTPEYSLLQKITGKTITPEGEIDFKQKFKLLRNDQNVAPFKAVPLGFQGDGKINLYFPWMDNKRILDSFDIKFLYGQIPTAADMLKNWIKERTQAPDDQVQSVLDLYQGCVRVTQSFLNDWENYRITQSTYDGWTADQKNKHHVGDIKPGQKISGIEATTLATHKTIPAATDRLIDAWRANHPDWQEADTLDWRLYVMVQKLLTATSTHCVTRFSVEADLTEKHRYYLPYYLTVSLPVKPDTSFNPGVSHTIKSAWYSTFSGGTEVPGSPLWTAALALWAPYGEKHEAKLSTPYVANLEDTESEPLLPETLVPENLNKIAGSLDKGTDDYLKYILHTPNDDPTAIRNYTNVGAMTMNNPNLGVSAPGNVKVTKKIPTTRWQWNSLQPLAYGYTGKAYIIPNGGWDIVSRELAWPLAFGDTKEAIGKYMATTSGDNTHNPLILYTRNPWWELTPKIESGDIVWDSSAWDMTDANVQWLFNKSKDVVSKFLYTKEQLEKNILNSLGFKSKPTGWTFKATPEVATSPQQWLKVDKIFRRGVGDPFEDSSKDIHVYRWRDIEATWEIPQTIAKNVVSDQPVLFDKLEWQNRRRVLTGQTDGIGIELASSRTNINFKDIKELYLTGIWLDKLSLDFLIPDFIGTNPGTVSFEFETEAKYDETKSSVRIIF